MDFGRPWSPGGISSFQAGMGRTLAERDGRPYESYGAGPVGVSDHS
ncbi:MAG: hypothetical protein ACRD0G_17630 [Acidimicrobiales bacterium]